MLSLWAGLLCNNFYTNFANYSNFSNLLYKSIKPIRVIRFNCSTARKSFVLK